MRTDVMHRTLVVAFLIAMSNHTGAAQNESDVNKGAGYVFIAPGVITASGSAAAILHFGAGGQRLLYKGLGMGGEIGYAAPSSNLAAGIGLLSVNGFYQFGRAGGGRKAVPFVTAGYSLAFRNGTLNGLNFGGGLNYWFWKRSALLIEVRDHFYPLEPGAHLFTCRIGLSFR